jgi:hypothetical protein
MTSKVFLIQSESIGSGDERLGAMLMAKSIQSMLNSNIVSL